MMNRIGMICIFLAFSVELNASSQALKEGLSCVTDYCKSVSCSLKLPDTSTRNISHWLEFQWNNHITDYDDFKHGPYRCPLQRAREDHTCTFTVNGTMTDLDKVAVKLHYLENGNKNSFLLNDGWKPTENIKPKAPLNLTLQYTNGTYHFSWTNGYEDERYGPYLPFTYTFLYYKDGDNNSEVSVHPENKMIQIDEMNLDPGTTYTAMVRSGIREHRTYRGTWSEWSSAVKWKTTYRDKYRGTPEGLSCVTDYCKSVSCSLKLPDTSTRNISHWLEFQWNNHITDYDDFKHGPYRCPLQRAREDHTCTFTVNGTMTDLDNATVKLHYLENGNKNSSLLNDGWKPAENIKPKAPLNLTLQYTNGTYHFSWTNGYEDERYGPYLPFMYKFLYYKDGDNNSEDSVHPDNKTIQIDEKELDPGTTYTAMVRSGIREHRTYRGTWSEWSSAVKWKTTYRDKYRGIPGLSCVTDYCKSVSCSLKLPDTSTRNISHWLEFQWNNHITDYDDLKHGPYRCPLQRAREDHTCTFTVNGIITDLDKVAVKLHYLENGTKNSFLLNDGWKPAENIKPKAPLNLILQYTNGTYHFSWTNGYEDERYGPYLPFTYTFLYYKDGDNNSEDSVHPENKMIQIDEMNLDPGTTYTAMVRSGIREHRTYKGTWSEWSGAVKWKTTYRDKYRGTPEDEPNQVGKIVIVMLVGLLILLIFVPAARFKMKEISWVPTPATYFQPLYQNYQGNFQCWVLAKSPLQDFHVLEDFSTIDKISEVMMTTLQDEEEKTGMYPAAQCHQPYVGPTAEVWVPRQMPDTCSETSIPCEEFSLLCEELPDKVHDIMQSLGVACLSGDVLSLKDSALSLESLEDCEESEAPVIINPVPVCSKQDYCTLTNTPTGPVFTFTRDIELDENTFSD
ncbi:uncharacterized protein LOC127509048 isoform X5 [Ctenopharyngodon idella]|uniref:uncharacterized protein LOC127509048 isoform X3 n=1 Tax=Ctenopharyngodon idella TaxID=7959 RepID=UPI0022328065|nr:uncharacterized protein LOC127509048 isoform X3 [Ctenopharyngodon idella]XP_051743443.1 uncharacterized protein LOC127509048 isoform X5 [Ctenopharyngodon idella]